jgi:hypothetical protein
MFTINELLDELAKYPSDALVKFDFGAYPSRIISWRGSYDEPSLDDSQELITVALLRGLLEEAMSGETLYHGYKGGDYAFNGDQILWADSYGRYCCRAITKVSFEFDTTESIHKTVILHTEFKGFN